MLDAYFINYTIFSAFLVLTLLETGSALLLLLSYNQYLERVMRYIVPIWEINGTFAVFYLVNLEATYPSIVKLVGTIYVAPVLAALIIFMAHNAFLAYSEYIRKERPRRTYIRIYSLSMVLVAFIAVSVLTSSVSGIGISIANSSITLSSMFLNGFNILVFIGVLLITLSVTMLFFRVETAGKALTPIVLILGGVAFVGVGAYIYVPYITADIASMFLYMIPTLIMFIVSALLYTGVHARLAKGLAALGLYCGIMFFGLLQYPYFFGKAVNAVNVVNTGQLAYYVNLITLLGGIFLASLLVVFTYYSYIKANQDGKAQVL